MTAFVDRSETRFTRLAGESAFVPTSPAKVLGFPVVKVYPQSLGTSIGFSLVLDAPLAKVRAELQRVAGKTLAKQKMPLMRLPPRTGIRL